jgi:hypothetical protein
LSTGSSKQPQINYPGSTVNTSSVNIFFQKLYKEIYRKTSSVIDFLFLKINLPYHPFSKSIRDEKPKIVFVGEGLHARISRIAKWIKRDGHFSIVLISNKIGYLKEFSNDEWDGVFLFRNQYHLNRILKQIKGVYLFHAFAPKSFYPDLVRQFVKEPFLIDMQDVLACYYGLDPDMRWLKKELPYEKNCLLYSDGIVAHSLEPNIAIRKYATKNEPPKIFFPLCSDNDMFLNNCKKLDPTDIHFVYAGGVAGSHRDKTHYGSIQFHELIKVLDDQHIHFHIYPSPTNVRADYKEYEQMAKNTEFFHFHSPVSQEAIAAELNRYHFGVLPFFSTHSKQSEDKYKYATSLKLFNYIEAGIPVLVSKDLIYQSWIVGRYNAGILIGKEDLTRIRQVVMRTDYSSLVENLIKRREELSLKVHIPRLLTFYHEIKENSVSNS